MLEIFEVYEYDVTQYDPQTGQGGLFVEYINTFLKLRTEASGYPSWVEARKTRIATSMFSMPVKASGWIK